MQQSKVPEILPEIHNQLYKDLFTQSTAAHPGFHPEFEVYCRWATAVGYDLALVELGGEQCSVFLCSNYQQ